MKGSTLIIGENGIGPPKMRISLILLIFCCNIWQSNDFQESNTENYRTNAMYETDTKNIENLFWANKMLSPICDS